MEWRNVHTLEDINAIDDFEREKGILFPREYKDAVLKYNGGTPVKNTVRINKKTESDIKLFLSFNRSDTETVYKVFPFFNKMRLIPFAADSAGNYFCFEDEKIVFWEHEEELVSPIADSFSEFIKNLF